MSDYKIFRSNSFSNYTKKYKKNKQLFFELDKKIRKFKKDPNSVGGKLSGKLFGYKSTRLLGKFRLIFKINEKEQKVYLVAIDHREFSYLIS